MIKGMKWGGMFFASLLMASSCQNEAVVSDTQSSEYTLNVSSFVGSRTYVEENGEVKWSEGDKLYVYGQNVSGVLTLIDGVDDKEGTFSGFVFGNPQNLQWAVFGDNVKGTSNGAQFTIAEISDPNSNSPMIGKIQSGKVDLEHLCGMVRITINNLPENADIKLTGTNIAGTAEVKEGVLQTPSYNNEISIKAAKGNKTIEVPVFATANQETNVSFTLSVNNKTCSFTAPVKVGALSQDKIKPITCIIGADGNVSELKQVTISNSDDLQNAINGTETNIALPTGNFTLSGTNQKVFVGSGEKTVIDITGNIQNVNISNATVTGNNSLNVQAGNTATFTNVVFEGGKIGGTNQGVVKGKTTFIGCTFKGGFHIDSSTASAEVKFIDCTFTDTSTIQLGAGPHYSFEYCTIASYIGGNGSWLGRLIVYSDITFTECTLGRQVRAGGDITITFDNCVDTEDVAITNNIINENPYANPNVIIK